MATIQTKCLLGALLCLALASPCLAQSPLPDTAAAKAELFYQSYIGADAAIYNGYAYQPNYQGVKGSPYFPGDNLTQGTMIYEGLTYTHLRLLYNTVLDQPILSDPQSQLLCPPVDKIRQFTIGDHVFIHFDSPGFTPGFYELVCSGYATLIVRHAKKIEDKIVTGELERYLGAHDTYYLGKQGHYYPLNSDGDLLNLLADKKQELRQFRRTQHLRFGQTPITTLQKLVEYYNQLPH